MGLAGYRRIEVQEDSVSIGWQPFLSLGARVSFLTQSTFALTYRIFHDDHENISGENTDSFTIGVTVDF